MTLVELLVAAGIFVLATTGIIVGYINAMELQEAARFHSAATKSIMSKIDQARSTSYYQIKATFHQVPFDIPGYKAKGVSYVDDSEPDLLVLIVSASWKDKVGRVHGEDKNLNGQIDGAEDSNGNGRLDGPVQLTTKIFEH